MTDSFAHVITDLEHIAMHSSDRGTDLHAIVARVKALAAPPSPVPVVDPTPIKGATDHV